MPAPSYSVGRRRALSLCSRPSTATCRGWGGTFSSLDRRNCARTRRLSRQREIADAPRPSNGNRDTVTPDASNSASSGWGRVCPANYLASAGRPVRAGLQPRRGGGEPMSGHQPRSPPSTGRSSLRASGGADAFARLHDMAGILRILLSLDRLPRRTSSSRRLSAFAVRVVGLPTPAVVVAGSRLRRSHDVLCLRQGDAADGVRS